MYFWHFRTVHILRNVCSEQKKMNIGSTNVLNAAQSKKIKGLPSVVTMSIQAFLTSSSDISMVIFLFLFELRPVDFSRFSYSLFILLKSSGCSEERCRVMFPTYMPLKTFPHFLHLDALSLSFIVNASRTHVFGRPILKSFIKFKRLF